MYIFKSVFSFNLKKRLTYTRHINSTQYSESQLIRNKLWRLVARGGGGDFKVYFKSRYSLGVLIRLYNGSASIIANQEQSGPN